MAMTSGIYGWMGGRHDPPPRTECSRATHARLIETSGKALAEARKSIYARYSKECRAWGREPTDETEWFMRANGACQRILKGG